MAVCQSNVGVSKSSGDRNRRERFDRDALQKCGVGSRLHTYRGVRRVVKSIGGENCSGLLFRLPFEFRKLFLPGLRGRQANVVLTNQGTDSRKGMFGTNIGIGMPTTLRLLFTVQRMQRGVECVDVFHNTQKLLITFVRKFRQSIFNPLKVPDIRSHQGFPQLAVVGNTKMKQFVDDNVILQFQAQWQNCCCQGYPPCC